MTTRLLAEAFPILRWLSARTPHTAFNLSVVNPAPFQVSSYVRHAELMKT
jgi:hypothetical protein